MALEIITVGESNANVTISRGELILTCHCIHPIHIMSYKIGPNLENKALEIIAGVVSPTNVAISSEDCSPTCHCIHPIHIKSDNIYLIMVNIALDIIMVRVYTANANISRYPPLLTLRYPVRIDRTHTHPHTN